MRVGELAVRASTRVSLEELAFGACLPSALTTILRRLLSCVSTWGDSRGGNMM
jgi:hypothetical protein